MMTTDSHSRGVFTTLLFLTMGVATFVALSIGIIAVVLIEDLGISRAQLGLVFAANTLGAAVVSPSFGRLTDRLGGRSAVVIVTATAAVAYVVLGVAPSLGVLIVGSVIGGVAQAGSNPATNKLIALDVPAGSRGTVTGIKQSGVQAFVFVGGLLVPAMAVVWGRLSAYGALAAFAVSLAIFAWWYLPDAKVRPVASLTNRGGRLPTDIWWITAYGFILGFSGSVTVLYALFATESLGRTVVTGGAVAAVVGLVAMPARILWARHAERNHAYRSSLLIIAVLGVAASVVLLAANVGPWWLVWIAALLSGAGPGAWNAVGMVALIVLAGPEEAGRASGVVLSGFLVGLGVGPPLFGWIIDTTGGYTVAWIVGLVASIAGLVIVLLWTPQERPRQSIP